MSHQHGAYLGGIRTVEDMRKRCRIDDITGCWHWGLAIVQGFPSVHFKAPDTGKKMKMRGRKAALYLLRGQSLPAGHLAFAKPGCAASDCVNPEHCRSGTKAQWGAFMSASGQWKNQPARILSARRANAARHGRSALTPEQIQEIRESTESTYTMAARLGVSHYCIWSNRVGKYGRATVPAASVFSWRP